MILRESYSSELSLFAALEKQTHASSYVNQLSIDDHQTAFAKPEVTYLTIVRNNDIPAGYFIIALESDNRTAEFRRLVVDEAHRGIGQKAIRLMEDYCKNKLRVSNIWLDVFEDNDIGIHIYEKLGYQYERTELTDGRELRFYRKSIA